jgi:hypothetical protein
MSWATHAAPRRANYTNNLKPPYFSLANVSGIAFSGCFRQPFSCGRAEQARRGSVALLRTNVYPIRWIVSTADKPISAVLL